MKHIFIVNPAAGKGSAANRIIPEIEAYFRENPTLSYEIYQTKAAGDGQAYAKALAKSGEPLRFYACGGDGTLFEVVNGVYRYPNAAVGIIPLGSGNDFARIFGGSEKLFSIAAQVAAPTKRFDLIDAGFGVALNQCSMGLDAEVCAKQAHFKRLPGVGGEFAYTLSLFYCLFRRLNSEFKIVIDDEKVYEGKMLFSLCANARWYGGGYKGAPYGVPDDGLLDFIVMEKTVGRLRLAGLVGKYKRGEHLSVPFTHFLRGKKMEIFSKNPAAVNVDGECRYVTQSTFRILEDALAVILPDEAAYEAVVQDGRAVDCALFDR